MLESTLDQVRCPRRGCGKALRVLKADARPEIRQGTLECTACRRPYPILEGVAVLVPDPRQYVLAHVKGVSQIVSLEQIPKDWREEFEEARLAIESEHIEEDLEAERVTSLYVMNHYLRVEGAVDAEAWWSPRAQGSSVCVDPLMDKLIREHWDHGPLDQVAALLSRRLQTGASVVELGCGVGGLKPRIEGRTSRYLGIDSSFASIAIARHLALGAPYKRAIRFPGDLLDGTASRPMPDRLIPSRWRGGGDFIVGDLESPPISEGLFDASVSLNAIDMLEKPNQLPELQARLVRSGGLVVQSCPYIWHESVAKGLRGRLPKGVKDSASAVEWLYLQSGLKIVESRDRIPWLFFKHLRQLELYSVHLFAAEKYS